MNITLDSKLNRGHKIIVVLKNFLKISLVCIEQVIKMNIDS